MELSRDLKSRQEVRDLVEQAVQAQHVLRSMSQDRLNVIVTAMANAGLCASEELANLACEETGFGSVADKIQKNRFASETVWKFIENETVVGLLRKDDARKIWEIGVPVGVIAAITPSTNPTATVIYKAMIALKAGNAIVFSPHPGASESTKHAAKIMAEAAEKAGCPNGAIGCITTPTMEAVEELMHHPKVNLILATGGPGMVKAAYSSGIPAIGVGAGNGPAYLHESCDLPKAVADIIRSKTFDHGTICASEQSIVVERGFAERAEAELTRQGAWILDETDAKQLSHLLFRDNGKLNPTVVGKSAQKLAQLAGLSDGAQKAKILIAREHGVGKEFPYSMEKLCPVLGLYVVESQQAALDLCCEILNHEGRGHTFSIHGQDEAVIRRFAEKIPVSRFLVNTPAALGGIGFTTALAPALTLGCGAVGGSSSSNNIGPMDLINVRRVACGLEVGRDTMSQTQAGDDQLLERLMDKLLQKLNG